MSKSKYTKSNRNCSVPDCKSIKRKNPELSFHKFPKRTKMIWMKDKFGNWEKERINKHQAWINALKMKKITNCTSVCSLHFLPEDFIPDKKNKILRRTAIPSVNLPDNRSTSAFVSICNDDEDGNTIYEELQNDPLNLSEESETEPAENFKEAPRGNCFVCNIPRTGIPCKNWKSILFDTTKDTNRQIFEQICDIISDAFSLQITEHDYICTKCENIILEYDKLIIQVNKIKQMFMELLYKKYNSQQDEVTCRSMEENNDSDLILHDDVMDTRNTELKIEDEINNAVLHNNDEILENNKSVVDIKEEVLQEPKKTTNLRISKIFKCCRCQYVANTEQDIKNHLVDHPDTSVLCIICRENFKTRQRLEEHLKIHDNVSCPLCMKIFSKPRILRTHILMKHSDFHYNESDNQKKSKHSISMEGNSRLPNYLQSDDENGSQKEMSDETDINKERGNEGEFKYCKKKIQCKYESATHEKQHTRTPWREEPGSYPCNICSKIFTHSTMRENHFQKEHTGQPWYVEPGSYPCKICGKMFTSVTMRKNHIQQEHIGEDPCVCKICGKAYLTTSNVKRHMVTHRISYMFNCKMSNCHAGFVLKHDYEVHLSKIHGAELIIYNENELYDNNVNINLDPNTANNSKRAHI